LAAKLYPRRWRERYIFIAPPNTSGNGKRGSPEIRAALQSPSWLSPDARHAANLALTHLQLTQRRTNPQDIRIAASSVERKVARALRSFGSKKTRSRDMRKASAFSLFRRSPLRCKFSRAIFLFNAPFRQYLCHAGGRSDAASSADDAGSVLYCYSEFCGQSATPRSASRIAILRLRRFAGPEARAT